MSPVASPCISVCQMNADTSWCEGCLRTIDEIAGWSVMSEDDKRQVWREIAVRKTVSPAAHSSGMPVTPAAGEKSA